MFQLIVPKQG